MATSTPVDQDAMSSGKNTNEYRKLIEVTPALSALLTDGNVIALSQKLLTAGLISRANNGQMMNHFVDAEIRAAKLVSMVTTKVELNKQNFYKFLEILKEEKDTYSPILDKLSKYSDGIVILLRVRAYLL